MKTAIDLEGNEVQVEDDVVTRMRNGVRYVLSQAELDAREAEQKAHEDAQADYVANHKYKDDRKAAYPSLAEQMDMQYWDRVNETTEWEDAIAAVKAAYPKPE